MAQMQKKGGVLVFVFGRISLFMAGVMLLTACGGNFEIDDGTGRRPPETFTEQAGRYEEEMEEIMALTGPFLPEEIIRMSKDLFEEINAERKKNGLEELTDSTELWNFGRVRAWETIESFSHTRPNGEPFWGVEYEGSVRVLGEIFFRTEPSSKSVIKTLMKSEAHRDLILDPAFHTIGISVERKSPDEYHFVILFGGKERD